MEALIRDCAKHLSDILRDAIQHPASARAVVIYDEVSPMAQILVAGYRQALPEATFVEFAQAGEAGVRALMDELKPRDLVILVQSTNFRLNDFRIRIELFQRHLATMEHAYLERMQGEQIATYVAALAYDKSYYHAYGHGLKTKVDAAQRVEVICAGTKLVYGSPMEPMKFNIGEYEHLPNVGGSFPIGEVFTEAQDLTKTNGEIKIFAFAGEDHLVCTYEPFKATITDGILEAPEGPAEFRAILDLIHAQEPVLVREFGLGLNAAMGKEHIISDITAFERMKGLHMSVGAKHGVYKKPGLEPRHTRYHIDVFIDVEQILVDGQPIYADGGYIL